MDEPQTIASPTGLPANSHIPTVSIGMPVHNGEPYIRAALEALLAQTFTDFELIISDNASTDNTELICREYAGRDTRIYYFRHEKNQGASANFQFVLDQARGEFFIWAACDDVRSPDFISINLDFLRKNPDFVASTSPVRFDGGEFDEIKMGDASLTGERPQRIIGFFTGWHANGRFYSLMRKEALKDCRAVGAHFFGADWAVVLHLAYKGKLNRTPDGWVTLGKAGVSQSRNIFRAYRQSRLDFYCPFARLSRFTWALSRNLSVSDRNKIALALLKINIKAFFVQFYVLLKRAP